MNPSFLQTEVISLNCRTIRIGTYSYTPTEKVYISSKGIQIVAPSLNNESEDVALQIQLKEVTKILVHFGKDSRLPHPPVIFLYTINECGAYIRKALDMNEDFGYVPYYNPVSKCNYCKRIILIADVLNDEAKTVLKMLFEKIMDSLNAEEAISVLYVAGAKSFSSPVNSNGGMAMDTEDSMCLAHNQLLNNVDYHLKHLVLTDTEGGGPSTLQSQINVNNLDSAP